ncbi:hypothetical protein EDC01DRAFT_782914 [Geopyxis carbonaria]|nr:hypothetical protein EDC01DRAFT_782914 [Geopyxis carbonaria]
MRRQPSTPLPRVRRLVFHHHPLYKHARTLITIPELPSYPVSSRKNLRLYIHQPPNTTSTTPTILHLPCYTPARTAGAVTTALLTASDCTVIVPYHDPAPPSQQSRFPLPLHDSVAALATVRSLFPHSPVGVYGGSFAGGLALSLGITESGVSAVAADRPVCDLFSRELGPAPTFSVEERRWSSGVARDRWFGSDPASWTDPFASPLFWLRTPGVVLPTLPGSLAWEREVQGLAELEVARKPRNHRRFDGRLCPVLLGVPAGGEEATGARDFAKYLQKEWEKRALVKSAAEDAEAEGEGGVWKRRARAVAERGVATVEVEGKAWGIAAAVLGHWLGGVLRDKERRKVMEGINKEPVELARWNGWEVEAFREREEREERKEREIVEMAEMEMEHVEMENVGMENVENMENMDMADMAEMAEMLEMEEIENEEMAKKPTKMPAKMPAKKLGGGGRRKPGK